MSNIHPSAIIEEGAQIAASVKVGPYCIVGKDVVLKDNVILHSHVVVAGKTFIDEGTQIFPFASIGHQPQDLKFHGEASELRIGKNNVIREHATMNPGTEGGGMLTSIGDNCLVMIGVHLAHDCRVGNNVILANNATLAGHVVVEDFAILGGLCAVHQFVRIGAHAMIGGMSAVEGDVIPFGTVMGERASLAGLNLLGLKRRGFEKESIHALRHAYKKLFTDEGSFEERLGKVEAEYGSDRVVAQMISFLKEDSSRALCQPA